MSLFKAKPKILSDYFCNQVKFYSFEDVERERKDLKKRDDRLADNFDFALMDLEDAFKGRYPKSFKDSIRVMKISVGELRK